MPPHEITGIASSVRPKRRYLMPGLCHGGAEARNDHLNKRPRELFAPRVFLEGAGKGVAVRGGSALLEPAPDSAHARPLFPQRTRAISTPVALVFLPGCPAGRVPIRGRPARARGQSGSRGASLRRKGGEV